MISTTNKFVFIHISKCGGTSVSSLLESYSSGKLDAHSTYSDYEAFLGESVRDYLVFACVRNPYDRMLSMYTYWRERKSYHIDHICIDGIDIIEATWKLDGGF